MMTGQPVIILREGSERQRGKDAQHNNIEAAKAMAEAVRSTLGPRGMDKMLVDSMGDVVITNDGATILNEIDIEHPAAKMIVEVAKTQDDECGDGTTSAVVFTGELLKKAQNLIDQNVHPTIVTNGFRLAANEAIRILEKMHIKVSQEDEDMLCLIASTAMTGKSMGEAKDHLGEIAVKAVRSIVEMKGDEIIIDIDDIKVEKKHGLSALDSELIKGVILDKERAHSMMPKRIKKAKIALINCPLEIKKTEVDAKIQIREVKQLQRFLDEEERTLKLQVDKIKKSGANVLFCQKGIDDLVQHFLAKENIFTLRRVGKSDMEKLSKATGAKIVTNLNDLTAKELGKAALVEEKKTGDSDMTFVVGCENPKSVSILIRGGTEHVVDEIERGLHDALKAVAVAIEDKKAVPGGGATEIELALRLRDYATTIGGREQLAIEAFAEAMEIIPRSLAENAGLDPIDVLINLRSAHEGKKGNKNIGIDVFSGKVKDMVFERVIEPLRVKTQAIKSATEVANMILRIDDVIASKRGAPMPPPAPGGGGMPPGMM
jgi:thermosome